MKEQAKKIPVVPITKIRRKSPGGFEVAVCEKDSAESEWLITPGDVIIWSCAAGVVFMLVWVAFGLGHVVSYVYRSVTDVVSSEFKSAPAPANLPPASTDPNIAAADYEMNKKSEEIKHNFNAIYGDRFEKFLESTKGMVPVPQKKKEVGTF